MNRNCKSCKSCPFSITCEPGALGGTRISAYVGQVLGPFFLPCHSAQGYRGNDTRFGAAQCAGAATMRSNLRVDERMPGALLWLPAYGDRKVFHTLHEFIAHHYPAFPPEMVGLIVNKSHVFVRRQYNRAKRGLRP